MTETGKIREIKDNLIIIAPDRSAACFGCMNEECRKGTGFITAENPGALALETGQIVEVAASGTSLLAQALPVLLPPVLSFIAGYFLLRFLVPHAGEGAFAGAGVLFLFITAFIVYRIRRKKPPGKSFTVTKIVA